MKRLGFALFVMTLSASPSWAAGLKLSMRDGLVSLDAQDVTVRQILTEWARVGKTRIINVERITGGPITLQFDDIPERQALDIILRAIPGYMAVPRATQIADASLYDSILIMATTTAVAPLRPQQPNAGFRMPGGMPGGQGGTVTQLRPHRRAAGARHVVRATEFCRSDGRPRDCGGRCRGSRSRPGLHSGLTTCFGPADAARRPANQNPQPAQGAPGAGAPTNPLNAPVGTPQPSLTPPPPVEQPPPPPRARPPQADR